MNTVISWIKNKRISEQLSWEEIRLACKSNEKELKKFLEDSVQYGWPHLCLEEWMNIVDIEKKKEEEYQELIDSRGARIIGASNEQNETKVSGKEDSAWQTYKRKLLEKGFSNQDINLIEDSNAKILRLLSSDTRATGAIKGLVVGNVQSGKTANMAALISMAADQGWNMFIILSGLTNNLRQQTIERILHDLKDSDKHWALIDNPSAHSQFGERLNNLSLEVDSKMRYLCVSLKQRDRLSNLINWFSYDETPRRNVRMLIIDDECDNASINTSPEDRSKINKLILELINNYRRHNNNIKCETEFCAVNYIGYTATPYANVLNETPGENSLYPKNFITTLPISNEYFGPQHIFGCECSKEDNPYLYDGLDIVRTIPKEDIENIADIHAGIVSVIPSSMQDTICWFLCGVAYMRYIQFTKPISMLVHTSSMIQHHEYISNAIAYWLSNSNRNLIIQKCREIWESESIRFTKNDLLNVYPEYAKNRGESTIVNKLPEFSLILPKLKGLLDVGVRNILVNEDSHRTYTTGIHLCVDNSDKGENNSIIKKLIYPSKEEMPIEAPAFIVVGGNTLSRGLTIEGLISTFFLRSSKTADTLMQMGRWFGYRKGYELLPRIWMSELTQRRFEFISKLDYELRTEIQTMSDLNISPEEAGPKILTSPSSKFLQIAAYNKIRGAMAAEYDFAGHTMETGVFRNNAKDLSDNLSKATKFIINLGTPDISENYNPYAKGNYIWRNVDLNTVIKFLKNYKYSPRLNGFNDLDALSKWLKKTSENGLYGSWNVILAGKQQNTNAKIWTPSKGVIVGMVNRTRRFVSPDGETMNIGVLRSFTDFLSDIPVTEDNKELQDKLKDAEHNMTTLNSLRQKADLESTPQLVIYIIDKDSAPVANQKKSNNRYPLNAKEDVVGFSINIPGFSDRRSTVQKVSIKLNPSIIDEPDIDVE